VFGLNEGQDNMGFVQSLLKVLSNSKLSFIPFFVILILGGFQFIFSLNLEWLVPKLGLSIHSLWGIFTNFYIHENLDHFDNNMMLLFILTLIYVFMNGYLSDIQQKNRSKYFMVSAFVCGISTNISYILIASYFFNFQGYTYGASGLVYAVQGIAFMMALFNLIQVGKKWFAIVKIKKSNLGMPTDFNKQYASTSAFLLLNFCVAAFFAYFALVNPLSVVNASENVSSFGHYIGFTIGMFSVIAYYFIKMKDFNSL